MRKDTRLNLRMNRDLLISVKTIADNRGVSLTFLIEQYFRELVQDQDRPKTDEELGVEQA